MGYYEQYNFDPWQYDDPEDRPDYQMATENETVVCLFIGLILGGIFVVELVQQIFS